MNEHVEVSPPLVAETELSANDRSRQVLGRLGADVEPYELQRGVVNPTEVVAKYGERFRDARVVRLQGATEFDDSGYYQHGDLWVLVAADVKNPSRVMADCYFEECQANPRRHREFSATFGSYATWCDRGLLFARGIVVARFVDPQDEVAPGLEDALTEEEWAALHNLAGRPGVFKDYYEPEDDFV